MSDVTLPKGVEPLEAKPKGKVSEPVRTRPLPPLDYRCPPRRVRHKTSGVITGWSTLFKKRLGEFEPYYRPDTDEEKQHRLALRRYEAKLAMQADAFPDTDFSSFSDEEDYGNGLGDPS
jgi:hypothetical protein